MILITLNLWLGPGRKMTYENRKKFPAENSTIAFASNKPLQEALEFIINYQKSYNEKYNLAINFKLLSVTTIDFIPTETLDYLGVTLAENIELQN